MAATLTLGQVKQFVVDHFVDLVNRPKLSSKEAARVCDQIAFFMKHHCTLNEALGKVADLTPTLLGRRVGTRTLQKLWDNRAQYGVAEA